MRNTKIPPNVSSLFDAFKECFTLPAYSSFTTIVIGWIVCPGRHTISRVIQAAAELSAGKHQSSFYRFLSQGRWCVDALGKVLFRKLLRFSGSQVRVAIDDTLCHKSGPHIFGAAMHYDAHKSTYGRGTASGRKGFFAFGYNLVVLSMWIPLPWDEHRGLAIPFLFRLYRSKKRCPPKKYRKRTEIAAEMIQLVARWLPDDRKMHLVGDSEYSCKTVVLNLPDNVLFTGAVCMDAALHEQPKAYSGRGRPRVKGRRLPSPKQLAASKSRWRKLELNIYGRRVVTMVKFVRCLWPTVAGDKIVQVVVTRDPKGRLSDRCYFSVVDTSAEQSKNTIDAAIEVLTEFARRWEIEVAFRNVKQSMGLQDPQNGWWRRPKNSRRPKKRPGPNAKEKVGELAVTHTMACVFAAYAITVVWYLEHGDVEGDVAAIRSEAPWYRHKTRPSFADMLTSIRREIWSHRLSKNPLLRLGRKQIEAVLPRWYLAA